MTSPIAIGTYLTYKFGKWVYEKMTSEDEPEQEIPLSPFPIANPVVYHFHPVAFVEQMRRLGNVTKLTEELIVAIITTVSRFEGSFSSCNKDTEFAGGISGLSYTGVVHIGLSWGYLQFTQDGGSLGKVLKRMHEKNKTKFEEIFGSNFEELLSVTGKSGASGLSKWWGLSKTEKNEYKNNNTEIRSDRVQKIATAKNGSELKDLWEEPWVTRFKEAGKEEDLRMRNARLEGRFIGIIH
ncbi:hypothetical protein [Saccharicrinis fermentans]|uniref:hypothetical protein n=1 Tax=Saccharicrinis fermentans TaxID=982 RepID=UPI0004B41F69|nr:hypothetical protein [Saccharicrinis fermentans]